MAKRSKECKKLMVEEIATRLNTRGMFIITNFKGLSSQDLNDLRKQLRDVSGEYLVIKDLIAKRAISEGPNSMIDQFIEGEVGIAIYQKEEPTYISKVLAKFSKEHKPLRIRGGTMDGDVLSKEDISRLASLPSKEVLLGQLANVLNAPIQGLAGALNAILCKILYALNAVKDKKEKADEGKRPKGPSTGSGSVEEKRPKGVPSEASPEGAKSGGEVEGEEVKIEDKKVESENREQTTGSKKEDVAKTAENPEEKQEEVSKPEEKKEEPKVEAPEQKESAEKKEEQNTEQKEKPEGENKE